MSIRIVPAILAAALSVALNFPSANAQQPQRPQPPQSLRLYVLDCGRITPANADAYGFRPSELVTMNMVTPCFLIVHPRGSLMWDTGEIPDDAFKSGVSPQKLNNFTVDRPLLPQLAAIGYTPANITYMALSHYHGDHVANASSFAGSSWIVQKGDVITMIRPVRDTARFVTHKGDGAEIPASEATKAWSNMQSQWSQQFGTETVLIDTRGMKKILAFDKSTGIIEVESHSLEKTIVQLEVK